MLSKWLWIKHKYIALYNKKLEILSNEYKVENIHKIDIFVESLLGCFMMNEWLILQISTDLFMLSCK